MPSSTHGLPYPAATDAPNVPLHLQQLAEALDAYIPLRIRKTGLTYATPGNTTPVDDPDLKVTLPPGTYLVTLNLTPAPANLAAADLKVQWSWAGANPPARICHGPGVATTDVTGAATSANRMSTHTITTPVAYGADGTVSSAIVEQFVLTVTATGVLALQWAQNTANATANSTGITGASNIVVQKVYQVN